MNKIIMRIISCILLCTSFNSEAQQFHLTLYEANLPEVLRLLANAQHIDIMISPQVTGKISLQVHHTTIQATFDALIHSAGLSKVTINHITYIAPYAELQQRQQARLQSREFMEAHAPRKLHFWRVHYAKAKEIANVLHMDVDHKKDMLSVDERTNTLYLYHTQEKINYANELIKKLDIPIHQILVRAKLVSIDEDVEKELGVQFRQSVKDKDNTVLSVGPSQFAFKFAKLANSAALDVKLSLLERAGRAELISSPSLYAGNRQSASIEAGEEVPYQQTSENGGTTIVFKKAVLGLHVVPQVLPHNQVLLRLKINQDRPGSKLILGMPTIMTRQMLTNVLVRSGETIVLGGIQEHDREKGSQQLPGLGRLPLIGKLFNQTSRLERRRHLLIFVTPTIVA